MVNQPKQTPSLKRKTAQHIMDGTNKELKETLTTKKRTNYKTIPTSEEVQEDRNLVNKNDRINSKYKNPNNAEEYLESDYDINQEDYDPMSEVEAELDRELLAEAKKSLKPNTIHQGEIMDFDDYGNAIVAIYGGDIQGIIYKADKRGLKV